MPRSKPKSAVRIPRSVLVGVFLLVVVMTGIGFKLFSSAASSCIQIVLPAYWYPNSAWTTAVGSSPPPAYLILDISGSGAGNAPNSTFQAYVSQAQAKGVRVIGYDGTTYGARSVGTVETEVQHYKAWYNVKDIFLDQVSNNTRDLNYYKTIYNYIHGYSAGSTVMLNPGVYPPQQYMAAGDIFMVFEDTYAHYLTATVPSWANSYPASRFAHTVHDASSSQWANALALAKSRNVGYVFITNGTGGNPYNGLPSYWSSEVASTSATCVAPTSTPTPTHTPTPAPTHTPTPVATHTPTPAPVSTPPAVAGSSPSSTPTLSPVSPSADSGSSTSGGGTAAAVSQLNTRYLTNGSHTITTTVGGKKVTTTIAVHNQLNPYETVRNLLFAGLNTHPRYMDAAMIGLMLVVLLGVGALVFYLVGRRPHVSRW